MKNRFLAIDTCGKHMTVLAGNGGKTVRFFLSDCSMRHSVLLMDGVDKVLKEADLSLFRRELFTVPISIIHTDY